MKIDTANSVEELRVIHNVRELDDLDNHQSIFKLPNGVYGYTVPWIINTDSTGVVGGTGVHRISLNAESKGTPVLEVHKISDDEIRIVGYVSENDYQRLIDLNRPQMEIYFLCKPFREYTRVISVPMSLLAHSYSRSLKNEGYVLDLTIKDSIEEVLTI